MDLVHMVILAILVILLNLLILANQVLLVNLMNDYPVDSDGSGDSGKFGYSVEF